MNSVRKIETAQMRQAKLQARTSNRVLSRAIKALKDKFEEAVTAEWDFRFDSATIRNAMTVLPNRCRQCKKPFAGISRDICTCRGTMGTERWLSNPRNTLLGLLEQRCQSVLAAASLVQFVEQITNIAVAHDRDLDWIEGQIEGLRPALLGVGRKWVTGICPPPFNTTGQLPAWLKDDGDILGEELGRSLSVDDSEAEFVRIEDGISHHFDEAKRGALDQVNIQLAQLLRPVSKPPTGSRQDFTAAMIAKIKRDNPEWSIEQICQRLDAISWPLRARDRLEGFSSWHAIWKDPKYRGRIKRFVSHIQPAAYKE